ncbi:hypothetical protein [Paenibacillus sp. PAMC21692]|uniref:hypothetical protein n=1 Tax=Paenibacillus sp. PAMC21692 TaxID=2762320 RepID=UPI00164ECC6D|nr:hypothetical protein [Paenibacillus sp. PAMC21692]QNK59494.1 hypothetical protein H7F31_11775 [Paenibacillus sp. PAMC21692]
MSGFGLFGIFLMFGFFLFLVNIATSVWAYLDAKKLGKSNEYALLLLIGTLIFPVAGLIVYLIIRRA